MHFLPKGFADMSIRSTSRVARAAVTLLALVSLSFAAPAALARGSFGISIAVPGIGISYSDHGRHGSWNGYVSGGYSSYGGYGYGGSPYYSSYNDPYYQPYYRSSHRGYYGGRSHYRPSRVVYYDHHDRGYRGDRGRYDDRGRRGDRGHSRNHRSNDSARDGRRGGYYDRGR